MGDTPRGYGNDQPKVDFQWLSDGWRLFKQEPITWIVAAILAGAIDIGASSLVSSVFDDGTNTGHTISQSGFHVDIHTPFQMVGDLLSAVISLMLWAGMFRMALLQIRGKKIDPFTFLSVRDVFLPLACVSALTYGLAMLGFLACLVPGFVLCGLFLFAPLYVVAEGAGPIEAIERSVNALKADWFTAILFALIPMLWIGVSALFCGVGEFATIPQVVLATAVGFCRFNGVDLSRAGQRTGSHVQKTPYGYAAPDSVATARPVAGYVGSHDSKDPPQGVGAAATGSPASASPVSSMPMTGAPDAPTAPKHSGKPGVPALHHHPPTYRIPRPSMRPSRRPRRYP
jgi:uncharacterized membrane protein